MTGDGSLTCDAALMHECALTDDRALTCDNIITDDAALEVINLVWLRMGVHVGTHYWVSFHNKYINRSDKICPWTRGQWDILTVYFQKLLYFCFPNI